MSVGRIRAAGAVQEKGARSLRRVEVAGRVADEGAKTDGRVEVAGCVASERIKTDGRVVGARGEGQERIITLRGVASGIASVGWGADCLRGRYKQNITERQSNKKTRSS